MIGSVGKERGWEQRERWPNMYTHINKCINKEKNTIQILYIVIKLVSFQGCKNGSTYANHECNTANTRTQSKKQIKKRPLTKTNIHS
jgi:hypothetical protein